jgi:DNA polymerase I-like protein with 3'-5' exonuclease and polymerase domains
MAKNYGLVDSEEQLTKYVDRLIEDGLPIGFDIETGYLGQDRPKASLHPEEAFIAGISFTNSTEWARYAPIRHDEGANLNIEHVAREMWRMLNTGLGVAHNAKFELRNLSRFFVEYLSDDPIYGESVRRTQGYYPLRSCTMLEAHVMAEFEFKGLKPLVKALFNHEMMELIDLFDTSLTDKKKNSIRFNILELNSKVVNYACEDALWCLAIHNRYFPKLKDNKIFKIEMAVLPVVSRTEDYGVKFDWIMMKKYAEQGKIFLEKMNAEIQEDLSTLVERPVDIKLSSPMQLRRMLYVDLGLVTNLYTKKEKEKPASERSLAVGGSTGGLALKKLASEEPVVQRIREWKGLSKLLSSYLNKYQAVYSYAEDGLTHPNLQQAGTVTGRFSASDPNYQQLPKVYRYLLNEGRNKVAEHAQAHANTIWEESFPGSKFDDRKCSKAHGCEEFAIPEEAEFFLNFRDVVITPDHHYLFGYDLSQAELRAIAGEAQEPALLAAFKNGEDVHTTTAALMLGIPKEHITSKDRARGKELNFSLSFDMSPKSLADRLNCPVEEAKGLHKKYFQTYSSIKVWTSKQVTEGKRNGYVSTKWGRKVPIWEFLSDKRNIYQKGERICINAPIQGSIADFVKLSMVRQYRALEKAGLLDRVHMVMNVHDAIEYYVHESVSPQEVYDVLKNYVAPDIPGWPPMVADWHMGKKWGSLEELEIDSNDKIVAAGTIREKDEIDEEDIEVETETKIEYIVPSKPVQQIEENIVVVEPVKHSEDEGKHVIIELMTMPSSDKFAKLAELIKGNPGANSVTVVSPQGSYDLKSRTSLTPREQAMISLILGGASVKYAPDSVTPEVILEGIQF